MTSYRTCIRYKMYFPNVCAPSSAVTSDCPVCIAKRDATLHRIAPEALDINTCMHIVYRHILIIKIY
ncbi:hypothetical protein XELAEV_18003788mg [Xenopus laevis]|uniref:Uncharacterized protein n=1 Tax=Xenopus laevis TaxID=8355 RepID=A0A974BPG5_XENLA|nr:hypothetical protein XELAEV_18003788mg [Xenopus laevis]